MLFREFRICFLSVMIGIGVTSAAMASMEAPEEDVSVRRMGVAWNIADDRKMENISGVYEPEGLDKYMKRYFDQLSSKLDGLSGRVDEISEKVKTIETLLSEKNKSKMIPPAEERGQLVGVKTGP